MVRSTVALDIREVGFMFNFQTVGPFKSEDSLNLIEAQSVKAFFISVI